MSFHSEKNLPARSREAMAIALTAAVATAGALATKASARAERVSTKTSPQLVSGAHPETLEAPAAVPLTELTPQQYKYTKAILDRVNNGPSNMNVIDVGGMQLMPGTKIYKAPMDGAVDHKIDKNRVGFMYLERLIPVKGELWAAARNVIDTTNHIDDVQEVHWGTDPRYMLWVKVSEAQRVKGFKHLVPRDDQAGIRQWKLPHVYQVALGSGFNLIINQAHPEPMNDPRWLANYMEYGQKYGPLYESANGIEFVPTSRPVRFEKANPLSGINPGE